MGSDFFSKPLFTDESLIFNKKNYDDDEPKIKLSGVPLSATSKDFEQFLVSYQDQSRVNLSASYIANALGSGLDGDAQTQASLFKAVIDKEPIISAHLETRKLAVRGVDWSIVGGTEYKRDKATKILEKAKIKGLISHLLDSLAFGYAGAGVDWSKGGSGINGFNYINSDNWVFNKEGDIALRNSNGELFEINNYPYLFVFHKHMLRSGIPSEGGLMRVLIWTFMFKNAAIKHRARFMEKYGIPFLLSEINTADFNNSTTRAAIKENLRGIGADGIGVITEGSKVTTVNEGAQGPNANFQAAIDYYDKVYALTILGQLASSGEAGGFSKGQAQENVRNDILAGDCENLEETINTQILTPLEKFKWGTEELRFEFNYRKSIDTAEIAKNIEIVTKLGFKPDRSWVEKQFSIPLEVSTVQQEAGVSAGLGSLLQGQSAETGAATSPAMPEAQTSLGEQGTSTSGSLLEQLAKAGSTPQEAPMSDLKSFADFNDVYFDMIKTAISNANINQSIKNELSGIQDVAGIFDAINGILIDRELDDAEKQNIANLRNEIASIDQKKIEEQVKPKAEQAPISTLFPPTTEEKPITEEPKPEDKERKPVDIFGNIFGNLLGRIDKKEAQEKLVKFLKDKIGKAVEQQAAAAGKHYSREKAKEYFDKIIEEVDKEAVNYEENRIHPSISKGFAEGFMSAIDQQKDKLFENYLDMLVQERTINVQEAAPGVEFEKREDGIVNRVMDLGTAFKRGYETTIILPVAGLVAAATGDDELDTMIAKARQYKNWEDVNDSLAKGIIGKAVYGLTEMSPLLMSAAIPGAGSAAFYLNGVGSFYNDMREIGIDRDIAIALAIAGGVPYAAIEKAQMETAAPWLKDTLRSGLRTVINDSMKQIFSKYGSKSVKDLVGKTIKSSIVKAGGTLAKGTGAITMEALEEVAQEFDQIAFNNYARLINDKLRGTKLLKDAPGIQESVMDGINAGREALPVIILQTLLGRGSGKVLKTLGITGKAQNRDVDMSKVISENDLDTIVSDAAKASSNINKMDIKQDAPEEFYKAQKILSDFNVENLSDEEVAKLREEVATRAKQEGISSSLWIANNGIEGLKNIISTTEEVTAREVTEDIINIADVANQYQNDDELVENAINSAIQDNELSAAIVPYVNVIDSKDAPANIAEAAKTSNAIITPDGVYLFKDNIKKALSENKEVNKEEFIRQVVAHELIGHLGINFALGNKLEPILLNIANSFEKEITNSGILRKYLEGKEFADLSRAEKILAAEEYIAATAETNPESSVLSRIISRIKEILRAIVPSIKYSDKDIINLIISSKKYLNSARAKSLSEINSIDKELRNDLITAERANDTELIDEISKRIEANNSERIKAIFSNVKDIRKSSAEISETNIEEEQTAEQQTKSIEDLINQITEEIDYYVAEDTNGEMKSIIYQLRRYRNELKKAKVDADKLLGIQKANQKLTISFKDYIRDIYLHGEEISKSSANALNLMQASAYAAMRKQNLSEKTQTKIINKIVELGKYKRQDAKEKKFAELMDFINQGNLANDETKQKLTMSFNEYIKDVYKRGEVESRKAVSALNKMQSEAYATIRGMDIPEHLRQQIINKIIQIGQYKKQDVKEQKFAELLDFINFNNGIISNDNSISFDEYIRINKPGLSNITDYPREVGRHEFNDIIDICYNYLEESNLPAIAQSKALSAIGRVARETYNNDIERYNAVKQLFDSLYKSTRGAAWISNYKKLLNTINKATIKNAFNNTQTSYYDVIIPFIKSIPTIMSKSYNAPLMDIRELLDVARKMNDKYIDEYSEIGDLTEEKREKIKANKAQVNALIDSLSSLSTKKTFGELTAQELFDITSLIKNIAARSMEIYQEFKKNQSNSVDDITNEAMNGVLDTHKKLSEKTVVEKAADAALYNLINTMQRLPLVSFILMDGVSDGDGPIAQLFYGGANEATELTATVKNELFDEFERLLKERGVDAVRLEQFSTKYSMIKYFQDLNVDEKNIAQKLLDKGFYAKMLSWIIASTPVINFKLENGETITLDKGQIMYLYCHSQTKSGMEYLTAKNGFAYAKKGLLGYSMVEHLNKPMTQEDIEKITSSLNPYEKAIADAVYALYQGQMGDLVFRKYEEENGIALERVRGGYMPQYRYNKAKKKGYNSYSINQSMYLQKRQPHANEAMQIRNLFDALDESINFSSTYYGYATWLRLAKTVANNKEFRRVLMEYVNEDSPKTIDDYITEIETGAKSKSDMFTRANRFFRRGITTSTLPLNIFGSVPAQTFSYPFSWMYTCDNLGDMAIKATKFANISARIASAIATGGKSFGKLPLFSDVEQKMIDEVKKYSPQSELRRDGGYSNIAVAEISDPVAFYERISKNTTARNKYFVLVRMTDRATMTQIMIDCYMYELRKAGYNSRQFANNEIPEEALGIISSNAADRTWKAYSGGQPVIAAKDLPPIARQSANDLAKLLTYYRTFWVQARGNTEKRMVDAYLDLSSGKINKTQFTKKITLDVMLPNIINSVLGASLRTLRNYVAAILLDKPEEEEKLKTIFVDSITGLSSLDILGSLLPNVLRLWGYYIADGFDSYRARNFNVLDLPLLSAVNDTVRAMTQFAAIIYTGEDVGSELLKWLTTSRELRRGGGVLLHMPIEGMYKIYKYAEGVKNLITSEKGKNPKTNIDDILDLRGLITTFEKTKEDTPIDIKFKEIIKEKEEILKNETAKEEGNMDNKNESQSEINKLLEFADEKSPSIQDIGKKMFILQDKAKAISAKLNFLKSKIAPYAEKEPIIINGKGRIFFVEGGAVKVANSEKIKEMLVKNLKISPELAARIIASGSTEKFVRSYLKLQRI